MKKFVKGMDNLPWGVKILFALPILDIIWAVYRIIKGAAYGKVSIILGGILWLILGWIILWIVDLISTIAFKNIKIFA